MVMTKQDIALKAASLLSKYCISESDNLLYGSTVYEERNLPAVNTTLLKLIATLIRASQLWSLSQFCSYSRTKKSGCSFYCIYLINTNITARYLHRRLSHSYFNFQWGSTRLTGWRWYTLPRSFLHLLWSLWVPLRESVWQAQANCIAIAYFIQLAIEGLLVGHKRPRNISFGQY